MIDFDALVLGPCMTVFGQPVTYYGARSYFAITGVFDEAYLPVDPFDEGRGSSSAFGGMGGITTVMPILGVQLSQFPFDSQPQQGDRLVICTTNATYFVKEVRVDSHGGAKLVLSLAAVSPK
jgi:hypothetical protein